jgi:hypothetical protein
MTMTRLIFNKLGVWKNMIVHKIPQKLGTIPNNIFSNLIANNIEEKKIPTNKEKIR